MQNLLKLFVLLILLINLPSCNNDDTPDEMEMNLNIPTPTTEFYLLGIIDDDPILIESNNGSSSEGYDICGQETNSYGGAWVDIDFTTFDQTLLANAYIHISDNGTDELETKYAAYSVGAKNIFDCNSGIIDGGEIVYIDDNEVIWSSNGAQDADAYFEILERNGTWTGDIFTSSLTFKVKGKFSCKLYDVDGNSKLITNGEFNSLFHFIQ